MFEVSLIPRKFVQPDESKSSNSPRGARCKILGFRSVWGLLGSPPSPGFLGGKRPFRQGLFDYPRVPAPLQDGMGAEKGTHRPSGFLRPRQPPRPPGTRPSGSRTQAARTEARPPLPRAPPPDPPGPAKAEDRRPGSGR